MSYSLIRYEQEVVINFNAEEETATIYTANPVWIRKMDKLVQENPEQFQMSHQQTIEERVISKEYIFPKRFISIRSKDKKCELTDEQRAAMVERLNRAR